MSNRWYVLIAWVAVLPRLAAAEPAATPTAATVPAGDEPHLSCKTPTGPVVVTFKADTEVKDLVTWAMSFTCKNFVLDPRIAATGKKVTILAPSKLTAREAYQMFLLALSTIGLTVVPRGNAMRVVESASAKKEALPIGKQILGDGDQVVRVVIRPSHAQAEALRQAFTSLKSDAGDIAVVGSMLVVTDYASTLAGMMSLKKLVDVPGGTDGIYTLPVRHGDATKVAQMLTTMFVGALGAPSIPGRAAGGEPSTASELAPSKILVDERTNTLVVSASEPAYQRVKALVERIDIAVDLEGGGSIHAYQLSHAIAEEVAVTLTKAIAGEGAAPRAQNAPARGQAPAPPQPAPSPSSSLDGLGATLQGAVRINADKATNKLLITASHRDFLALKDIIRELDEPRRQVYIEAMILEVAATNGLDFGASSHIGGPVGSGIGIGGVQLPNLSSLKASSTTDTTSGGLTSLLSAGLVGGVFGSSSRLFGVTIPSYGVLFKALATQSNTNILSTPSIIALDNEEAKSKIGEDIPYSRGAVQANPVLGTAGGETFDRKKLELELNIKPHISANDTVLLEIKHSAETLKDETARGPTWTTRSVETRVVVRDQETVLIGGLMKDQETASEEKVPILGDIPLLGYLFKYTKKTKGKTNLLIMLTPYIIKDHIDLQKIRQRKLRENDEFFGSIQSLDGMRFEPRIDYSRKRGMVEEINRAVQSVEADVAAREAIQAPAGVPEGRIEPASEPDAP